jgi:hypothetical protein
MCDTPRCDRVVDIAEEREAAKRYTMALCEGDADAAAALHEAEIAQQRARAAERASQVEADADVAQALEQAQNSSNSGDDSDLVAALALSLQTE